MDSLIEVSKDKIAECMKRFDLLQAEGDKVAKFLREKKTKVRTWLFFKKEVSVWMSLANGGLMGYPIWWSAREAGYITPHQARALRISRMSRPDFGTYIKHGEGILLSSSEYDTLYFILETDVEEEGSHSL